MKRFLSIFLALTMILAMMPTTFAAVDEATGAITYNFVGQQTANIENIDGTWVDAYKSYPENPADPGANWAYRGTTISTPDSSTRFVVITTKYIRTGKAEAGEWLALRINVPEDGVYTVTAKGMRDKSYLASADLYIAPLTPELGAKLTEGNETTYGTIDGGARSGAGSFESLNIPETAKVGEVTFSRSGSGTTDLAIFDGADMTLSAGDNIVLFKATAETAGLMCPTSLTLTPEVVTVEPTITVSPDKEVIFTGDEITLSAVVTDSTGATVSNPTVEYTTENTDIVSITGNVVEGLAEGTATITATYVENETPYTYDVEITVKSSAVTYKFYSAYGEGNEDAPSDISAIKVSGVETVTGVKNYSDYGTDRPWAYLGGSSELCARNDYYTYFHNGCFKTEKMQKDDWVAFKIKVPKTASYSISGKAYLSDNISSNVDIYIAPLTGTVKTTFETASIYSTVDGNVRSAGKSFDALGLSDYHVGNTSMKSDADAHGDLTITDAKKCILYEDTEYVLLFKHGSEAERIIAPRSITLTPSSDTPAEEDIETIENAFDATATATAFSPSITATAYTKDTGTVLKNAVTEVSNGDGTYTLTAGEIENYRFLYWAKGLTTERTIVSFIPEIQSYKPTNENNILIAVYENTTGAADTAKAEFYNANRQLLGTITDTNEGKITLPYLPSMAGYTDATHWELYGDTEKTYQPGDEVELTGTMLFVAQYDNGPMQVTVNGDPVPYGTLCEFEAEEGRTIKWWTKTVNGKTEIVSLSDKYSFCAWENCTVEPVYAEAKFVGNTMKIVLARLGTDAVMAEFIGFDSASVAEKGIMLDSTNIAMKTANTQFVYTGLGSATEACGYAIIKNADGTTYTKILDGEITLDE